MEINIAECPAPPIPVEQMTAEQVKGWTDFQEWYGTRPDIIKKLIHEFPTPSIYNIQCATDSTHLHRMFLIGYSEMDPNDEQFPEGTALIMSELDPREDNRAYTDEFRRFIPPSMIRGKLTAVNSKEENNG